MILINRAIYQISPSIICWYVIKVTYKLIIFVLNLFKKAYTFHSMSECRLLSSLPMFYSYILFTTVCMQNTKYSWSSIEMQNTNTRGDQKVCGLAILNSCCYNNQFCWFLLWQYWHISLPTKCFISSRNIKK